MHRTYEASQTRPRTTRQDIDAHLAGTDSPPALGVDGTGSHPGEQLAQHQDRSACSMQ